MPRKTRTIAVTAAVIASLAALPATAGAAYTTPTSVDFGSQPVGVPSAPRTVTLVADCANPVVIVIPPPVCLSAVTDLVNVSPGTTGDFSFTTTCPAGLGPLPDGTSQSCPIEVTFTPASGGVTVGSLSTGTMGPGGLLPAPTVDLTGNGVASTTSSAGDAQTTLPRATKKCTKKKKKRSASSAKKRKCKKKKKKR